LTNFPRPLGENEAGFRVPPAPIPLFPEEEEDAGGPGVEQILDGTWQLPVHPAL
jgi:hypothetical protein